MDIFDILLAPFYLLLVFFIAYKYKAKHQHKHAAFKYFLPGLGAKIIGAVALGLIYFYYYNGGDTLNYYWTSSAFVNVFFDSPIDFIHLYFGNPSYSDYFLLKGDMPFIYWIRDDYAYFVSRCLFPFILLGAKSYVASAILLASFCYISVWQLYMVFVNEFPEIYKELAYSLLFVPSVIFWGSGIMKDSVTLSATCLFVYGFYWFVTKKTYTLYYGIAFVFAAYLLLSIKPYILFALMPGAGIWIIAQRMKNVKNLLIKVMLGPLIIIAMTSLTLFVMSNLGDSLGKYSLEKVLSTAKESQNDLKQSYYNGNSFDIGNYDASLTGLASVSHKAIFATLFRPTLLDVRNFIMFFSAVENTFILGLCIYLLVKLQIWKFFLLIRSHPLVLFSFSFAVFFAISLGVSVSNYGTLVRLKIPCVPFFIASLVVMNHIMKVRKIA